MNSKTIKNIFKKFSFLFIIFTVLTLSSCDLIKTTSSSTSQSDSTSTQASLINITTNDGNDIYLTLDETITLQVQTTLVGDVNWISSDTSILTINEQGLVTLLAYGSSIVTASIGLSSDSIQIFVVESKVSGIYLSADKTSAIINDEIILTSVVAPAERQDDVKYQVISGAEFVSINENIITATANGVVKVVAIVDDFQSNIVTITIADNNVTKITLTAEKYFITVGETVLLNAVVTPTDYVGQIVYEIEDLTVYTSLNDNEVTGIRVGTTTFIARIGDVSSNTIEITVIENGVTPESIEIRIDTDNLRVGEKASLYFTTVPVDASKNITYSIISGSQYASIIGNTITAIAVGTVTIVGKIGNVTSLPITINITEEATDPYENMSESEFYANYTPATSYKDATYRTLHNFMSGEIEVPDQAPITISNQPKENQKFIRNADANYYDNNNTYLVVDKDNNPVLHIFKGAAYITLEEVAAYIFAFGDIPANYNENKNDKNVSESPWGEYLRLNHSYFSGDTSNYPYEPELPDISGNGGNLSYYELDIGTTGTDCDPNYDAVIYNNGNYITRGAARIVYTRYRGYDDPITNINDKYLFYTYNHYNDFQEYLNYYGGWGEMFGNITGGGEISSRQDYNPTPYVETVKYSFKEIKV